MFVVYQASSSSIDTKIAAALATLVTPPSLFSAGITGNAGADVTRYMIFGNSAVSFDIAVPMARASRAIKIEGRCTINPLATSTDMTVYKNGAPTALVLTFTAAETGIKAITANVDYAVGDTFAVVLFSRSGGGAVIGQFQAAVQWSPVAP